MKRAKRKVIFFSLFIVYIVQGISLLIENEKLNSITVNKIDNIISKTHYNNDIGNVMKEITSLGFSIENINKLGNEISANIFFNVSDESMIDSLESLKNLNYSIEEYNIIKNDNICGKFSIKAW